MATLKIIEYLPSDHSLNVVIAIIDKNKELGRVTVCISPEWTKREAIKQIVKAVDCFLVTQAEVDKIKSLIQGIDGVEIEALIVG